MYYAGAARNDFVEYDIEIRSSGARPERYITHNARGCVLEIVRNTKRKKRVKRGNRMREG